MSSGELGGRRRVRRDGEALVAVRGNSGREVIFLGPMYLSIILDMIEEFRSSGRPIAQDKRDEIIARHSRSNGATIMGQLREKHALQSASRGSTHSADVVPRFEQVVYVDSRTHVIAWPEELKGRPVNELDNGVADEPAADPGGSSPAPDVPLQIAEGACVLPPTTEPLNLGGVRQRAYVLLIEYSRTHDYALIKPDAIEALVHEAGLTRAASVSHAFDHDYRVFIRVSGTPRSHTNPLLRALVFRPYVNEQGQIIIPDECLRHPSVVTEVAPEPEPVPEPELQAPKPQIRSKADLQSELEAIVQRIASSRAERDRLVSERSDQEHELQMRIAGLREQLEAAERALENLRQSPSERTDQLAREIESDEQLQARFIRAIDAYDDVAELLLMQPS